MTNFIDTDEFDLDFKPMTSNRQSKPANVSNYAIEVNNPYTAPNDSMYDCDMDTEYSEYLSETNQFLAF